MNPVDRRDFLRGCTVLASASLLPSLTRFAQAQDQNTPPLPPATTAKPQIARGRVLLDRSGTGKPGANAPGVPNVRVSNGRDVVATDAQGRYQLPVTDNTIIFIQKPAGYRVPLNELNQPRFYYIHKPQGSTNKAKYQGIAPTGELPASVDFVLIKETEPEDFRVVLWGDPQVRNIKEVGYVTQDVSNDLSGVKAAFGMCLGDNTFNNLSLFRPLQDAAATLGVPWHSVIGNHDLNLDAPDESVSSESFKSFYGPTYYSFDYGQVHFVALDNVLWLGAGTELKNANYTGGFGEQQLTWLKNDLAGVPTEKLVVLFMHIPIVSMPRTLVPTPAAPAQPGKPPQFIESDRQAFFDLLKNRPRTLSISGHTHVHNHTFLQTADGWTGRVPHHHFNCGTVSGSWWSGYPDEQGIPHTTMRDGTPNGYAFLNVNKSDYTIDWRSARSNADYQMNVTVPTQVPVAKVQGTPLKVNVFNGSAKTRVEARIGNAPWMKLQQTLAHDPGYDTFKELEASIPAFAPDAPKEVKDKAPWIALPAYEDCPHLWQVALPALPKGAHWIEIRATDHWNRTCTEKRLIEVM